MPSAVGICNSALIKLGQDRITSLAENHKRAIFCNEQYDKLRQAVLREHPWKFAIKRAQLTAIAGMPVYEWAYSMILPVDCLRVISTEDRQMYTIEGGLLLSNANILNIKYISDVANASLFDTDFAEALAARIARDLAYPLVQSVSLKQMMDEEYKIAIKKAKLASAQEGTPEHLINDLFINARLQGE